MFTAFQAVKNLLVGKESEEEEDDSVTPRPPPQVEEEKAINGIVTSINNGYGLIDGDIYFTVDVMEGNRMPSSGDAVHVIAERKHALGGWRAVSVLPVSETKKADCGFDDNQSSISSQTKIGTVTSVSKTACTIDNHIHFSPADTKFDFIPYVGDLVRALVQTDSTTGEATAQNVEPLRIKEFEGKVTMIGQGSGMVDNEIHFTFGACKPGTFLKKGDSAVGTAIESSRGKATWRAMQITKAKPPQHNRDTIMNR